MTLGDRVVVMCDGWVRQADSPLSTYQLPADRFVAGFLGMPPMNFLEGHIDNTDGTLWFDGRDARLRLEGAPSDWLQGESRRSVVAGFRPECIELLDASEGIEGQTFEATVQVTEPLGSTMDVYLQTPSGHRIVCRTAA